MQSDSNVKKISNHITKKVSDKLTDLFKNHRDDFEKKWDDLKLFIQYGMLTNDKFYESAKDFFLYKNTEGKYFTFDEYKNIIKDNQTDKKNPGQLIKNIVRDFLFFSKIFFLFVHSNKPNEKTFTIQTTTIKIWDY